jgi:hypothetical protein
MAKKPLTDIDRLHLGLHAAAYMRWMETRKRTDFFAEKTHAYIEEILEMGGFAHDPSDVQVIETSAQLHDPGAVDEFIKERGFFGKLDALT